MLRKFVIRNYSSNQVSFHFDSFIYFDHVSCIFVFNLIKDINFYVVCCDEIEYLFQFYVIKCQKKFSLRNNLKLLIRLSNQAYFK